MAERNAQIAWQGDIAHPTGLAWLPEAACLLVCDPDKGRLASLDPDGGAMSLLESEGETSFCFPTRDGELLLGSGSELVRLNADGESTVEIRIDMPSHLRTGTGTADRFGRLWFSAPACANDGSDGRVYRYHDGRMIPTLFDRCRPGGVALSADGRTLYFANGAARQIETHKVSAASALSNDAVLVELPAGMGEPRGIALDVADHLWVAMSGGRVLRIAPDGTIADDLAVDAGEPIDLAFGGPELSTLFVSTPGAIHAIAVNVSGAPVGTVKLSLGETLGLIEDDDH